LEVFAATGFAALNEERVIQLLSASIAGNFNEEITETASVQLRTTMRNRIFPGMDDAQSLMDIFGADTIGNIRKKSYDCCLNAINRGDTVGAIRALLRAERDILTDIMNKLPNQTPAQQALIGVIAHRISEINSQLVAYGDRDTIEKARKDIFLTSQFKPTDKFFAKINIPQWKVADISEYDDMNTDQLRNETKNIIGDEFAKFAFGVYAHSPRYEEIPSHDKDMLKLILLHMKNLAQELTALRSKPNRTAENEARIGEINTLISFIRITSEDHGNMCPNRLSIIIKVIEDTIDIHALKNANGGGSDFVSDKLNYASLAARQNNLKKAFIYFFEKVRNGGLWALGADYNLLFNSVAGQILGLISLPEDEWTRELLKNALIDHNSKIFLNRDISLSAIAEAIVAVEERTLPVNGEMIAEMSISTGIDKLSPQMVKSFTDAADLVEICDFNTYRSITGITDDDVVAMVELLHSTQSLCDEHHDKEGSMIVGRLMRWIHDGTMAGGQDPIAAPIAGAAPAIAAAPETMATEQESAFIGDLSWLVLNNTDKFNSIIGNRFPGEQLNSAILALMFISRGFIVPNFPEPALVQQHQQPVNEAPRSRTD
jgi:hypothetical protein